MPLNCSPTTTHLSALDKKKKALSERAEVDYALWGGFRGNELIGARERNSMAKDVIGFKGFLSDSGLEEYGPLDEPQLEDVLTWSGDTNKLVGFHAEWGPEIDRRTEQQKNDDLPPRRAYLSSRPIETEKKAVETVLNVVDKTDSTVHFVHVSSPELVRMIARAQESGVDVSVETCPHYLTFDEDDFLEEGAILKCAPPLRSREAVEGLWECISEGKIDFIASDHSPCPWAMREADSIWDAWGGIQNVQYVWLSFLDGVNDRGIDLESIVPLTSVEPASRFNLDDRKGSIENGQDADLTILSDEPTRVETEDIQFKHQYTPYEGFEFSFAVDKTIVRGNVVYDGTAGNDPSGESFPQTERIGHFVKPALDS
jgi:allantoinase